MLSAKYLRVIATQKAAIHLAFLQGKQIATAHLTRLRTSLADASRGRYGQDVAVRGFI